MEQRVYRRRNDVYQQNHQSLAQENNCIPYFLAKHQEFINDINIAKKH